MNANECGEFEILISADVDGELDEGEREALDQHLSQCVTCRNRRSHWEFLGEHLRHVQFTPPTEAESPFNEITLNGWKREMFQEYLANNSAHQTIILPESGTGSLDSARGGRWLLGIAAGILVALGVSFGVFSNRPPAAIAVSADPLVKMHAINVQTEQDQQATIRAMALELRTMKLEMRRLKLDPQAQAEWEGQIDSLLTKTRQLDSSSPDFSQGE
jgi:anti-sigma factor RsiW